MKKRNAVKAIGRILRNSRSSGTLKQRAALIAGAAALLVLLSSATYAWFLGNITTDGASLRTGRIDAVFKSYRAEDGGLSCYTDTNITSPESSELSNAVQGRVGVLSAADQVDEMYFVVEKNSGCIPLDVELSLNIFGAENDGDIRVLHLDERFVNSEGASQERTDEYSYLGGFWYRLQDVTAAVAATQASSLDSVQHKTLENGVYTGSSAAATALEKVLFAYISGENVNNSPQRNLLELGQIFPENRSKALESSDYCVYRLTVGLKSEAAASVAYQNSSFLLEASLRVAQIDALETFGNSATYYAGTVKDLEYYLSIYKPGDSIVLTADMEFVGDLVITKPLNLYLSDSNGGHTLTVSGNLMLTYPYADSFLINTSGNGCVIVKKNAVTRSGGNFEVDVPAGNLQLQGSGNSAVSAGDIYVENEWRVNCAAAPYDSYAADNAGYGLTVTRAYVRNGKRAANENDVLERVQLMNNTQLTVSYDTVMGQVYDYSSLDSSVERISVINYGTINAIDLSNMSWDSSGRYTKLSQVPQIFVDNYGTVSNAVVLPSWSLRFAYDNGIEEYVGNTRIIKENGAIMNGVAGTHPFTNDDIETPNENQYVIDVDGDGKNLRVYYTDFDLNDEYYPTLSSILLEYVNDASTVTEQLSDVTKLTVISSSVKKLMPEDYSFMKSRLTGLVTLDLSQCRTTTDTSGATVNNAVPSSAFNGMSGLKYLTLPAGTVTLGTNCFNSTSIVDLYLPEGIASVASNVLNSGILYVHPQNATAVVTGLQSNVTSGKPRYIFMPASLLTSYRSSYGNYKQYLFKEAEFKEDQMLFVRVVSSTDAQVACYVGPATPAGTYPYDVNFRFDTLSFTTGESYRIVSFDDYAFYNKLMNNSEGNAELVSPQFSQALSAIGNYAFYGCTGLGLPTFSAEDGTTIGLYAFQGCSKMSGNLILQGVSEINACTFKNCSGLTGVEGRELSRINPLSGSSVDTFSACLNLRYARFPNLTFYGYNGNNNVKAFVNCPKLAVVEIGCGSSAAPLFFDTAWNLYMLIVHTEKCTAAAGSQALFSTGLTMPSHGAVTLLSSHDNGNGVNYYSKYSTSNTTKVSTYDFTADKYCYADETADNVVHANLGSEEAPVSMSDIGYGDYVYAVDDSGNATLLYCTLASVQGDYQVPALLDGHPVTAINDYAYRYVKFVNTTLTVPASVTKVGMYAFYDRDGLVSTPEKPMDLGGVELVNDCAFEYCDGIGYLQSSSVKSIYTEAFRYCTNLTEVRFPNAGLVGRTSVLKSYSFANCPKLTLLETGVLSYGSQYFLAADSSLRLWIVNTENAQNTSAVTQIVAMLTSDSAPTQKWAILISSADTGNGNAYSKMSFNESGYYHGIKFDTGRYTASDYRIASLSEAEPGVTRTGLWDGYIDYIYVVNDDGNAEILWCGHTAVSGDYRVPASFTDEDGIHPVVKVGSNAFRDVPFSNSKLTLPSSLKTIGGYAFYGRSGLVNSLEEPLDLKQVTEIGSDSFYQCTGLKAVEGDCLKTIGEFAFYGCSALRWARFPSLRTMNRYSFSNCTKLGVLETSVPNGGVDASGHVANSNTKLWVLHTETATGTGSYYLRPLVGETTQTYQSLAILISSADNGNHANYWNSVLYPNDYGGKASYALNTGSFEAPDYRYTSIPEESNVARVNLGTAESPVYLSDIGYGDYVYALDTYGNATLLCCCYDRIDGSYTVPAYLDGHPVTTIGSGAYSTVVFTGGSLTLPQGVREVRDYAFGEHCGKMAETLQNKAFTSIGLPKSLETLGNRAFFNCTDVSTIFLLTADNATAPAAASNLISSATNYAASNLTVFMSRYAYENLYTAGRWGNIPRSRFAVMDVQYQPGDAGPVFCLSDEGTSYCLDYVLNVTDETELVIPAQYTDGLSVERISATAFTLLKNNTTLERIVLPENLRGYSVDGSLLPASFLAYDISSSNRFFSVREGVLYNKAGTVLLSFPTGKSGVYTLDEDTLMVAQGSFTRCAELTQIIVPYRLDTAGVAFAGNVFSDCPKLTSICFATVTPASFLGDRTVTNCGGSLHIYVYESLLENFKAGVYRDSQLRDRFATVADPDNLYELMNPAVMLSSAPMMFSSSQAPLMAPARMPAQEDVAMSEPEVQEPEADEPGNTPQKEEQPAEEPDPQIWMQELSQPEPPAQEPEPEASQPAGEPEIREPEETELAVLEALESVAPSAEETEAETPESPAVQPEESSAEESEAASEEAPSKSGEESGELSADDSAEASESTEEEE